jgi:hypothetical protein
MNVYPFPNLFPFYSHGSSSKISQSYVELQLEKLKTLGNLKIMSMYSEKNHF